MKSDPEYKSQQKISYRKWLINNPEYWRQYRLKNKKENKKIILEQKEPTSTDALPIKGSFYLVPENSEKPICKVLLLPVENS